MSYTVCMAQTKDNQKHQATYAERIVNGRRGWRIVCSCGETWLRQGSLERALEQTFDLHLQRIAMFGK